MREPLTTAVAQPPCVPYDVEVNAAAHTAAVVAWPPTTAAGWWWPASPPQPAVASPTPPAGPASATPMPPSSPRPDPRSAPSHASPCIEPHAGPRQAATTEQLLSRGPDTWQVRCSCARASIGDCPGRGVSRAGWPQVPGSWCFAGRISGKCAAVARRPERRLPGAWCLTGRPAASAGELVFRGPDKRQMSGTRGQGVGTTPPGWSWRASPAGRP
jgi:hypothetical protein